MAYEINFCETKEQLKHLAEVVTGRVDGKATGAVIEESALAYLGQARETLDALLAKIGWYSVGEWSTDPLVEFNNQFVTYNGVRYVPLTLPYQVNSIANPDPNALVGTQLKVITDVTDGDLTGAQEELVGGNIYPESGLLSNGMTVPAGATHLRVSIAGKDTIVAMYPVSTGTVSLLSETGATIGNSEVKFSKVATKEFEYLYDSNGNLVVDGAVFAGDKVVVDNYYENGNSGTLFFRVVPGGTGTHDGGKYIDLPSSGFQLEQNLRKPYNASSWGQVGDLVADDTTAITNALLYARNSGRLVINGQSLMTSPLTFVAADRGMFIEGDGSQSYGEFNTGKPSTLYFSGLTTGDFCVTLDSIYPFRIDGLNIESDDWTVNGLKTTAPTRELIINDFSIKGVAIGMETHDTFVVRGENVGITARSKGISFGGGTTFQLENLKLQGDKTNLVRLDRGLEFVYDAGESDSPVLPNVRISGFCQYSNTVVYTDNSSCQVELDSFDVEDNAFAVLWLRNQYKGSYRIRNSALLINDGSNVVVSGEGNQHVTVDIDNPLMKDKHMITKDWSTEKFINTETSSIGTSIEFVLDERTFNRVKSGIVATAMPRVKVTRSPFAQDPDCLLQIGSGTMPEDMLTRLWKNKQVFDVVNNQTIYYGTKSAEFSNGMGYRIVSQDTTTNTPLVAYFTMRTVDGSQYFNLVDEIGTMPLTYDDVNDELVFTAATSAQRFVITCG